MKEEIMVEGKLMWKYRGKLLEYPTLEGWL